MPNSVMSLSPAPATGVPKRVLNAGQQAASDGFMSFLFSKDKEFNVSGPPGSGKSFWMAGCIDEVMPAYFDTCKLMGIKPEFDEVAMTATTNKAAAVVAEGTNRPTSTIHSFMNLKVTDDYSTGQSRITQQKGWKIHERKIIFIDECSMIDSQLDRYIQEGTHNCKIVYVGDRDQLTPVMEGLSPIYKRPMPSFELTQQMRNNNQPALMAACQQLRDTVRGGVFKPLLIVPGVIDLLEGPDMELALQHVFAQQTHEARILAYTNKRVVDYNNYIRGFRLLPGEYTQGEMLINNNAIRMPTRMLSVEEEVEIVGQAAGTIKQMISADVTLELRLTDLKSAIGDTFLKVPVPVDREHFSALIDYYRRRKDWSTYFKLRGEFPDLRPRDAATLYKAQGSTHECVFIDLEDVSSCRNADQAARMLYVGLSRARTRIFLYGALAAKFGGLVF